MKKSLILLALSISCIAGSVGAATAKKALKSPVSGVVCDQYICVNATDGVSIQLTEKYLGKKKSDRLSTDGDFDHTEFTFANGVFCDVKEKLCRKDRYYGEDGKRSGAVDEKTTVLLFGKK